MKKFLKFQFSKYHQRQHFPIKLNADYEEAINFDLINYNKPKGVNANIFRIFKKEKNKIEFNEINYKEKNSILIKNLIFIKKNFTH